MPTLTLPVREGGKVLGETEVSIPDLAFVPETAVTVVAGGGRESPLLAWAGRLWGPVTDPDTGGAVDAEAFAALVTSVRDQNPFAQNPFDNPFEPSRFLHPLAVAPRAGRAAVLAARLAEISAASRGLSMIDGKVHRAVPEPMHHLVASNGGFWATVRFAACNPALAHSGFDAFRADRGDDAEAFVRLYAERHGAPYMGRNLDLRVTYTSVLSRDDVHGAFADAFGRFERSASSGGIPVPGAADLSREASGLLPADGRMAGIGESDAARELLDRMRALLRPVDSPTAVPTLTVLDLVARRYDDLDRPFLATPPPSFGA